MPADFVRKFSKTVRCVRTSNKVANREIKVNNNRSNHLITVRLNYKKFFSTLYQMI